MISEHFLHNFKLLQIVSEFVCFFPIKTSQIYKKLFKNK